jgi:hypothetical protein
MKLGIYPRSSLDTRSVFEALLHKTYPGNRGRARGQATNPDSQSRIVA